MKIFLLLFIVTTLAFSKGAISIEKILQENFSQDIAIEKKSLILSKEDAKKIQEKARAKLHSKIVRLYTLTKGTDDEGFAVLLRQKIRTKNAAVLYMFDIKREIQNIEIISFNEPLEYKPNQQWQDVFRAKGREDMLIAGKDIPTISGATLSARALSDAARVALAILEVKRP